MAEVKNVISQLKSSPVIKRYPKNPILSAKDVPYKSTLVFNAGVEKYQGKYVMVFRNVSREGRKFFDDGIGLAFSDDGIKWEVQPKPCFERVENVGKPYDPRITLIDGRIYICFAVDTEHGIRAGVAVTDDFEKFEVLNVSVPDNRNMVLFPEKIGNKFTRIERPFPVYGYYGEYSERFEIWISDSPDARYWGNSELLLSVNDVPFSNLKIGPAAQPVKTKKGWLTLFHAVDFDPSRGKRGWEDKWQKRYTAGIMLLDLENPKKIVGLYKEPLIAPEFPYETEGYRNDVIFPCGMILENDGEVKIYYGAADTVECLATADVNELLELCHPYQKK